MNSILSSLSIAVTVLVAAMVNVVSAQDILPFPPAPSASQAEVTIESSTYKKRVEPRRLPADAPNILIILMDDLGNGTIGMTKIEYLKE